MNIVDKGLRKIGKMLNEKYGDKPTIEANPYTELSNDDLLSLVKEVHTLGMCDSIANEPKSELMIMLLDKENKTDGLYMNYSHVRVLIEGEFLYRVRNGVDFTKGKIRYHLVLSLLGDESNSFHPESFKTVEELKTTWETECKNRCKNDGYDEYWNKIPLMYEKITTETFFNN